MVQNALGRFKETENNYNQFFGQQPNPEVLLIRTASASLSLPREVILQAGEILASNKIPALDSESNNAFVVRYTIYKWYWDHLSLRGMPYDEQGFQLTESHWIQDTHNIYLDYGINFGIPVMILFTVFIWYGIGRLIYNSCKQINVTKMSCLLITLVPPIFGLFEFAWGSGMLYTIAFYLCFSEMLLGKDNGYSLFTGLQYLWHFSIAIPAAIWYCNRGFLKMESEEDMLNNKSILITGGTGSFGKAFTKYVLENYNPTKIIIYSRDEFKQFLMQNEFRKYSDKLRFFIGDVRDKERLKRAFEGVDYVIHAAALKQVPACEYNPAEAIKTNINGAQNVIDAALDTGVKKVVALSTDKAVNPVNLYGGTKLVSDKLFIAANAYAGSKDICFSIVRYGNVAGSRGSVIPFFHNIIKNGGSELPITDYRMTRFWISLRQGVELVIKALAESKGGETFISKIPSFKITDLAQAMLPGCQMPEVGIREGEKLHEIMVTVEDSPNTYEYDKHFIVYPQMVWSESRRAVPTGKKVPEGFSYSSENNTEWLTVDEIKELLNTIELEK